MTDWAIRSLRWSISAGRCPWNRTIWNICRLLSRFSRGVRHTAVRQEITGGLRCAVIPAPICCCAGCLICAAAAVLAPAADLTSDTSLCYNVADNWIAVSWQARCMAASAEQDNRVKIPDGTAAVSAEVSSFGENRSLGVSREGRGQRRGPPAPQAQVRRPTRWCFSCAPRAYGACMSRKNGRGTEFRCHGTLHFRR